MGIGVPFQIPVDANLSENPTVRIHPTASKIETLQRKQGQHNLRFNFDSIIYVKVIRL